MKLLRNYVNLDLCPQNVQEPEHEDLVQEAFWESISDYEKCFVIRTPKDINEELSESKKDKTAHFICMEIQDNCSEWISKHEKYKDIRYLLEDLYIKVSLKEGWEKWYTYRALNKYRDPNYSLLIKDADIVNLFLAIEKMEENLICYTGSVSEKIDLHNQAIPYDIIDEAMKISENMKIFFIKQLKLNYACIDWQNFCWDYITFHPKYHS